MELDKDLRSRQEVRDLVGRAHAASQVLAGWEQRQIDSVVKAVSDAGLAHARELAEMACAETGFGNVPDKTRKNEFAAGRVYEAIRSQKTVGIIAEHLQEKILDVGVPVGVVAGIVPSTNPTSTVLYKALVTLKAGSAIVFSPHPGAVKCTLRAVEIAAEAARKAGCPEGAVSAVSTPTMAAVEELMRHEHVRLILATGGAAMVHAAYSSGKPAIGVGAGNGPAYIHHSADLARAVRDIIVSKTFDNGTICASEQSVVVEASMEKAVREEMARQGCCFLNTEQAKKLAGFLFLPGGGINVQAVGRTAPEIAGLAGLDGVPDTARVLVARENEAGPTHPYSREKLCPILAFYVEPDEAHILEKSCEILRHEGSGHTYVIHAEDQEVIRRFGQRIPVSRFLVNTPAALGGIGAATNLFPALTLGCGAVGGSSSSNNIGPMDLINIRRIAWGVRDMEAAGGHTTTDTAAVSDKLVDELVARILQKLNR